MSRRMFRARAHRSSRPDRKIRGLRVGTVLLVVSLVPLAGVALATFDAIRSASDVAAAAEHTEVNAEQAAALARLDAAIFDEMVWAGVRSVAVELDAPAGLLDQYVGGDPDAQVRALARRTDELAVAADRPDVLAALADARLPDLSLREILQHYGDITDSVEAPLTQVIAVLRTTTTGSANDQVLVDEVGILERAIALRSAIADQFYGYFAVNFDVRHRPSVEIADLIDARARYDTALVALRAHRAHSKPLTAAVGALSSDPATTEFAASVDEAIDGALTKGLPPVAPALSLTTMLARIDDFANILVAMNSASGSAFTILDEAVDDVIEASDTVRAEADHDIRYAYLLTLVLMITSLATALFAARYIVRPLRGLRRAADALQSNQSAADCAAAIGGPAEVQAAAQAMQDAAAHVDLVTRQARALAAGTLDAAVLDEVAPGGLGAALQRAVATLRSALTQQDEFRRRLAHEAAHDGLTKLANRNASMAQLSRSLARVSRSSGQLAVLFIDLDRFKDVNDLHGHQAGDAVLTTVAQRLVNSVREGDHVGRLGGDEFVVIAEPVHGIDETVEIAQRILAKLNEPIELEHTSVVIGASIGVALADSDHLTADELLRDADLAVYRAKDVGRGGIEICDEDLRNELAETTDLTNAIRHAIEHDELIVYYQPIVDTQTEQLHALEALVRWRRPGEDGLVPPDQFIGFAERSTLIIDLDCWVLDAVARQIARWSDDPRYGGVPVAINVSGRHLASDHFVAHVLEPLNRHGVDPHGIIIEVTESALLDDLTPAAVKLQQLRDAGVLVSIDDFGTGYTSLAHLRSLPIDILKIDRSFTANATTNPHEESIVKLIIDTGHLLGATITAEGVETVAEATKLSRLGSDNLQGFFFARPQPPDQLAEAQFTPEPRALDSRRQ